MSTIKSNTIISNTASFIDRCAVTQNITFNTSTAIAVGVDEAGRGCLYGNLSVCALALPEDLTGFFNLLDDKHRHLYNDILLNHGNIKPNDAINSHLASINHLALIDKHAPNDAFLRNLQQTLCGLNDSKKLSEKKRRIIYDALHVCANFVVVDVPADIIDVLNIHNATLLGVKIAVETLLQTSNASYARVLIDGLHTPVFSMQTMAHALPKADGLHSSVASASIVAKVHRDRQMLDANAQYPNYGFIKHKGYPTKVHLDALKQFGALSAHRKSYAPVAKLYSSLT